MQNKKTLIIILTALLIILIVVAVILKFYPSTATPEEAKQAFEEQLTLATEKNSEFSQAVLTDKRDNVVPLGSLTEGMDIKLEKSLENNIQQNNYKVFFCSNGTNNPYIGLMFRFKESNSVDEFYDIYDSIENGLRDWDQSIFPDLQNLLFPNSVINSNAIAEFHSTVYNSEKNYAIVKYANFKDTTGKDLSIDYTYLMESVFISNNKDCLRKVLDYYGPSGSTELPEGLQQL